MKRLTIVVSVIMVLFSVLLCGCSSNKFAKDDICIIKDNTFFVLDVKDMHDVDIYVNAEAITDLMKMENQGRILKVKKGTKCKILIPDSKYSSVYLLSGEFESKTGYVFNTMLSN
jgi:Holliday junction resolvase